MVRIPMSGEVMMACKTGDFAHLMRLHIEDPNTLFSQTPNLNNCLHIAVMLGHDDFAKQIFSWNSTILGSRNLFAQTPLNLALMAANYSLALEIISRARSIDDEQLLGEILLSSDMNGDTALHHAIRNGLEDSALDILRIAPQLSERINRTSESAMFMATRKRYINVVRALLEIPYSSHLGPKGRSIFYDALQNHNTEMIRLLLRERPMMAYEKHDGYSVLGHAVYIEDVRIVKLLLELEPNLAYVTSEGDGDTPFHTAAFNGFVQIAEEILSACPDSVYCPNKKGQNALHLAVLNEQLDFVFYVLGEPQLRCLLNQSDNDGELPLHYAARQCNPVLLRLFVSNHRQDVTARNGSGNNAIGIICERTELLQTTKWNESYAMLIDALHSGWKNYGNYILRKEVKQKTAQQAKLLTERFITNAAVVAALLATITFAAAFSLPGGYSSDSSDKGLPTLARKAAFQLFLIFDTIAMCSSLAVAFSILSRGSDTDSVLIFGPTTKFLIWCAYVTTLMAFGTGLFTVIAPRILWLAILILIFCCILPFFSKFIGDLPRLMLRFRLRSFHTDLVPKI